MYIMENLWKLAWRRRGPRSTLFVMKIYQSVEQPDAEARSPAPVDLAVDRRHGRASDVEMRPRGAVLDEALQELRGRNRPAPLSAGVLHVGDFRVDHLVVFRSERQTPQSLAGDVAGVDQPLRKLVVVAEQASMLLAERDHHRAGQRREIDDRLRLEALLRVPKTIGKHHATFGVGVEHLDGLPRHRSDDVARTLRPPARHVLDE